MIYSIRVQQNLFLQKDGSSLGGQDNALVIPSFAQAVDLLHQLKDLNPVLVYSGTKELSAGREVFERLRSAAGGRVSIFILQTTRSFDQLGCFQLD